MKYTLTKIITVIAILSFTGLAQIVKSQTNENFTSLAGAYSINLPQANTGFGSNRFVGETYFSWRQPEAKYEVSFYEKKGLPKANIEGEFSFDRMVEVYLNHRLFRASKIYSKEIYLNKFKGAELKFESEKSIFLIRVFAIKERVYRLFAEIPLNKKQNEKKVLQVFDTFRLLDSDSVKEQQLSEIEKATPKALPQNKPAWMVLSDAKLEEIKGNVKSVIFKLTGYNSVGELMPERMSSYEEFNKDGNITKQIVYNSNGNATEVRTFGFIKEMRVSNLGNISNVEDVSGISFGGSVKPESSDQFDEKYVYKFREGKLIESQKFLGMDFRINLSKYVYRKNIKEKIIYNGDEPSLKIVYEFDLKGFEIKISVLVFKNGKYSIDEVDELEYKDFDENGNWTKRIVYNTMKDGLKLSRIPDYQETREIIYY